MIPVELFLNDHYLYNFLNYITYSIHNYISDHDVIFLVEKDYYHIEGSSTVIAEELIMKEVIVDELSGNEVQRISSEIENRIQKKVDVTIETDASIVGGIKFRVGFTLIDGSVSNQLQKIRDTLIQV